MGKPFLISDKAILAIVVPRSSDHRLLALVSIRTALAAIKDGDLTAARLFIEDAQAHLLEMAKCNSD